MNAYLFGDPDDVWIERYIVIAESEEDAIDQVRAHVDAINEAASKSKTWRDERRHRIETEAGPPPLPQWDRIRGLQSAVDPLEAAAWRLRVDQIDQSMAQQPPLAFPVEFPEEPPIELTGLVVLPKAIE